MPTPTRPLPAPDLSVGTAPRDRAADVPGRANPRDAARRLKKTDEPAASADAADPSPTPAQTVGANDLPAPGESPAQLPVPKKDAPPASRDVAPARRPPDKPIENAPATNLPALPSQTQSDTRFTSFIACPPRSPTVDPVAAMDAALALRHAAQRLTEQQKTAIDLILAGKKFDSIAQQLGVHRGTLWRWRRQDQNFRHTLAIARNNAMEHASEQLRELVPKALEIVQSQLAEENYRAAISLLRIVRIDRHDPPPTEPGTIVREQFPGR